MNAAMYVCDVCEQTIKGRELFVNVELEGAHCISDGYFGGPCPGRLTAGTVPPKYRPVSVGVLKALYTEIEQP